MTGAERVARLDRLPLWTPALVTLLLGTFLSWRPSFWLDEASTLVAADRPFGEIVQLSETIDRVHTAYYLLLHPWLEIAGHSEFAVRLPSAAAMALSTAAVVAIGRRLGGRGLGLRAGLVFAALPIVSHHAMDARPFPFALAATTWAGWALVRGIEATRAGRGAPAWWLLWAGLSAVGALFSFYAILIPIAHVVTVVLARIGRRVLVFFGVAVLFGAAMVPWALAVYAQRSQVALQAGGFPGTVPKIPLWWVTGWFYTPKAVSAGAALLVLGGLLALSAWGLRPSDGSGGRAARTLPLLAVPWLLLPPTVIVVISVVSTPALQARYLLGTVPALALLAGRGWQRLPHRPALLLPALIVLVGVGVLQVAAREEGSRENLRSLAELVAAHKEPGDAVLFSPGDRVRVVAAYPQQWSGVTDLGHRGTARETHSLIPAERTFEEISRDAASPRRVWVVGFPSAGMDPQPQVAALAAALQRTVEQSWVERDWVVYLTTAR